MNYSGEDYYRYKIIHGIQFDVRQCPDRNYGKNHERKTNIFSEDAGVCLSCVKKKCTGSKRCYEKRYDALRTEKKKSEKRKEVME